MPKLFISYRRDDSAGYAGRLYDRLTEYFGSDNIFMDIDTIAPGTDFIKVINNAIEECDIMLVIIGKRWLTITDDAGRRRLDSSHDFVRLEVQTGLTSGTLVIPLLVGGAAMPGADQLPSALIALARRNAFELRDTNWHSDVGKLIEIAKNMASDRGKLIGTPSAEKKDAIKIYPDVMRWFGWFGLDNGDFFVYSDRFEFRPHTQDILIVMPFDEITNINTDSVTVFITVGSQEYKFNRTHFGDDNEITTKFFFDYMKR